MNNSEILQNDAHRFINKVAKAHKMLRKQHESLSSSDIYTIEYVVKGKDDPIEFQMHGIYKLAELVNALVVVTDWVGNKSCDTNYDYAYFDYRGTRFFELIEKGEK